MWLILKHSPLTLALLFAPGLVVSAIFLVYPVINGVRLSLTNASPMRPIQRFVGLSNYTYLLSDRTFWEVLANSFVIVGAAIAISMVAGFALALLLNQGLRGTYFFRVAVFQIWVVPWISVAILWGWVFNADYGIVNYVMVRIGLIGHNLNWFADPYLARLVIILGFAWRMIPFMMVVSLAALQSISKEILDAAAVDGAGPWERLRDIVLPLLRNILVVMGLLQGVKLFQEITLPWVLTQGGPVNATTTLSLYAYKLAFQRWDFGLASTVGTLWLCILLVFALAYLRFFVSARND
ncbi:sugar ABC transporter permease [Mesorhizobium sp. BAC0120]|uniref:carbohydrate ABC transporter permease n=1 Tax=Mesorhizobium sp. BAC0120 TaxID=3090670 RepID=UPI00298D5F13|nr:sugar ABC transporter permease [Mesorhizobium sp. BAC0120]MDW6021620.1 sugar ABC transporter permease [Mesorhizobium sp. BAC0120]